MAITAIMFFGGLLAITQVEPVVYIHMSSAIDYARRIAHDEGYDVENTNLYTFDPLSGPRGTPFKHGYTAIGFDIDLHPRNLILINNSTGQAIDFNTCEVFDYPDLRQFQHQITKITGVGRKTPAELAKSVGCSSPKVLTQPTPVVR